MPSCHLNLRKPLRLRKRLPKNAGDKGSCLCHADADGVGLASHTRVEDVNIYIARGQITAGEIAHGNVNAAGGVVKERASTDGRVVVAGGVV